MHHTQQEADALTNIQTYIQTYIHTRIYTHILTYTQHTQQEADALKAHATEEEHTFNGYLPFAEELARERRRATAAPMFARKASGSLVSFFPVFLWGRCSFLLWVLCHFTGFALLVSDRSQGLPSFRSQSDLLK